MDPLLKKFETRVALSGEDCAKLLGYARSSYFQVRHAASLPSQVRRLVEIIMDMSDRDLRKLITKYVGDDDEL